MPVRFRIVFALFVALVVLITLCTRLTAEKREAQAAKLKQNLREAKLARLEMDQQGRPIDARLAIDEATHDFGELAPHDRVSHTFRLVNEGTGPLRVKIAGNSCDCATTDAKELIIKAGDQDRIKVDFHAEREGAFEHSISFTTNDPAHASDALIVRGKVVRDYWLDPPEVLEFRSVEPGQPATRQFQIFVKEGSLPQIENLRSSYGLLSLAAREAEPEEVSAAGAAAGWTISATWGAKGNVEKDPDQVARKKEYSGRILFDLRRDGHVTPKFIHYWVDQAGVLQLAHDRLDITGKLEIGNLPYGEGKELMILARATGPDKAAIQLAGFEANPKFLKAQFQPLDDTVGSYKLSLTIPSDAPIGSYAGDDAAKIVLRFTGLTGAESFTRTLRADFYITRE